MKYDIVCAGELLVDLISTGYADSLGEVDSFQAHAGGSPANLAMNLSRLGIETGLIATTGKDSFSEFLRKHVENCGLGDELLLRSTTTPSTLITVTKTSGSPDFEVYRGADQELAWSQFEQALAGGARMLHTTCFALSGLPARSLLIRAAEAFAKTGAALSIDANYAEKVWPDRARAQEIVKQYAGHGALVKVSEVDWERLYQEELTLENAQSRVQFLIDAGARLVCCTFGGDGACVVSATGVTRLPAKPIKVVDATGAGDSFWSGFLAAYLNDSTEEECLKAGLGVAAVKLQKQGPLTENLDWRTLV